MDVTEPAPEAAGRLSIGEAADLAGLSVRAVRHYHAIGLLPEPGRDASGYRRYGAPDVIAMVRIARLRALRMPLRRIGEQLGGDGASPSSAESLSQLADELDQQIRQLGETRDRLRDLAARLDSGGAPSDMLRDALRKAGDGRPQGALPANERPAAELLDALHPQGIAGVIEQAGPLLADPDRIRLLGAAVGRFRALDPSAADGDIAGLVADVVPLLPRPEAAARPIDGALMAKLLGDRLNPAQLRFMTALRGALAAAGSDPRPGDGAPDA